MRSRWRSGSARQRARPAPQFRQPASLKWVELEDTSILSRFHRMVEIDPIDDANEPHTARYASSKRAKKVAKELNSLCRVQLGRAHFFLPAARDDGGAAGRAKVAHPLPRGPGGPDPTPTGNLDDRQRRGARQAALPATNGYQPIGAQRN